MSRLRFCFEGLTVESNHSPYNPGTAPWRFIAADPRAAGGGRRRGRRGAVRAGTERRAVPAAPQGADRGRTAAGLDRRCAARRWKLLTAAYHSARTGAAVRLPLGRDHPLYAGWLPAAEKEVA